MQKNLDYLAPDIRVIEIIPEESICTSSKYSVQYPDGNTATHAGPQDDSPLYPTGRYGGSTTEIWK